MALPARILDDLARAVAAAASRLIDHAAKGCVLHRLARTRTTAVRAGLRAGARCCTRAMAGTALIRTRDVELDLLAEGRFLKGDLEIIAQIAAALWLRAARLAASATAEEHIEYVIHTAATEAAKATLAETAKAAATTHAAFKGRMTELVVLGFLLGVLEDIVGLVDFLEFLLGSLRVVAVEVRMIFAGHFLIGLLDLRCRRALLDAQHLIIIAFIAHVAPSLNIIVGSPQAPNNPSIKIADYFLSSLTSVYSASTTSSSFLASCCAPAC